MVRFKNRYLLFEIVYESPPEYPPSYDCTQRLILNTIKDSLELHFGDYAVGMNASSLAVKYFSPFTHIGIVRANRDHYNTVWAAMTFLSTLRKAPCFFRVLHTGGTVKSCQKFAIDLDRDLLLRLQQRMQGKGKPIMNMSELTSNSQKEINELQE